MITAYSSFANPIQIIRLGDDGISITTSTNVTNYTQSLSSNGVIQGCFAYLNLTDYSGVTPPEGYIIINILRNGQVIYSQYLKLSDINANTTRGILIYETLSFLAGAEVQSGDSFTLQIDENMSSGTFTCDLILNMVVRNVAKVYQSF